MRPGLKAIAAWARWPVNDCSSSLSNSFYHAIATLVLPGGLTYLLVAVARSELNQ